MALNLRVSEALGTKIPNEAHKDAEEIFNIACIGKLLETQIGRTVKGGIDVNTEFVYIGRKDLRGRILVVFNRAAQHLRQQKARCQMHGTDLRQVLIAITAQANLAPAFV